MASVLVVDDSKYIARVIEAVLETLDMQVVGLARDGLEALELFAQHRPDVTLLDVTMPNMDGVECLQKIRELDATARVVMLSAVHDEETVARCLELGASTYLQKPIRLDNDDDQRRLQLAIETSAPQVC